MFNQKQFNGNKYIHNHQFNLRNNKLKLLVWKQFETSYEMQALLRHFMCREKYNKNFSVTKFIT